MKRFINILAIIAFTLFFSSTAFSKDDKYEVHFLDTGQSDCILIKGNNHNYLIDTGAAYYTEKILDYLKKENIKKIDRIILTHYHDDHFGGLYRIIASIKTEKVLIPAHENKYRYLFYRCLTEKGIRVEFINRGYELIDGKINLKAIAPFKEDREIENNNSIVILGKIDGVSYFFSADCEKSEEKDMISNNVLKKCDILKIPHHCLATSSTEEFLKRVEPKFAIITSNGVDTPDLNILKRIKEGEIEVLRTDELGVIVVRNGAIDIPKLKLKYKIKRS